MLQTKLHSDGSFLTQIVKFQKVPVFAFQTSGFKGSSVEAHAKLDILHCFAFVVRSGGQTVALLTFFAPIFLGVILAMGDCKRRVQETVPFFEEIPDFTNVTCFEILKLGAMHRDNGSTVVRSGDFFYGGSS
jgi:hypothetical protein